MTCVQWLLLLVAFSCGFLGGVQTKWHTSVRHAGGGPKTNVKSVWIEKNAVFSSLQVLSLVDGKFPIPEKYTSVVMEIGANNRNTMDVEYLPRHPDAFLLTFEPLIDKYSALHARHPALRTPDRWSPLGFHTKEGLFYRGQYRIRPGSPNFISPQWTGAPLC